MSKPLFIFKAVNGKPSFAEMSEWRFKEHLLAHEGKVYEIYLRGSKRTLSQNALYWKFLEEIEFETGNNADDLHQLFRRTLLPPKFITVLGKEIKVPKSTTDLSTAEFSDYMDKIAAESGVPIPDSEYYKKYVRDNPQLIS